MNWLVICETADANGLANCYIQMERNLMFIMKHLSMVTRLGLHVCHVQ
jgi:hypothetical protein